MSLKCKLLEHNYETSEIEPSQTFKVPCGTDNPQEYIKKTTKLIHYKCTRCSSKKTEEIVDEELVIDDWKSDKDDENDERITQERSESYQAHQEAKKRDPPVELGEIVEGGVTDITYRHNNETEAVIRVESFVIFVNDVSDNVEKGDILRAKVTSFGTNMRCAHAILQENLR